MADLIFSSSVHINIQGNRVLRLVNRYHDFAEYQVIGFGAQVILRDYRTEGLKAIDYVLHTQDTGRFPTDFNGMAHLSVFDLTDDKPMVLELRDTAQLSNYLLWIAIGFDGRVPILDYEIGLVQKIDASTYALLAVLDMVANEIEPFDYSSPVKSAGRASSRSSGFWFARA